MTDRTMTDKPKPRVVIIGAGFGGLNAALAAARLPVKITIVDRKNHHTFQPLLYQVATAGLSPGEIAMPVRAIVRERKNVEVLMAEVTGFDLRRRVVLTRGHQEEHEVSYDYLVVAGGGGPGIF